VTTRRDHLRAAESQALRIEEIATSIRIDLGLLRQRPTVDRQEIQRIGSMLDAMMSEIGRLRASIVREREGLP